MCSLALQVKSHSPLTKALFNVWTLFDFLQLLWSLCHDVVLAPVHSAGGHGPHRRDKRDACRPRVHNPHSSLMVLSGASTCTVFFQVQRRRDDRMTRHPHANMPSRVVCSRTCLGKTDQKLPLIFGVPLLFFTLCRLPVHVWFASFWAMLTMMLLTCTSVIIRRYFSWSTSSTVPGVRTFSRQPLRPQHFTQPRRSRHFTKKV